MYKIMMWLKILLAMLDLSYEKFRGHLLRLVQVSANQKNTGCDPPTSNFVRCARSGQIFSRSAGGRKRSGTTLVELLGLELL